VPRSGAVTPRELVPDPVYHSTLVTQLINKVLQRGKKTLAESIVQEALVVAGQRMGSDPLKVLESAVANVKPELEVRSRRVGGATYQVPVEVPERRARILAIRWIVGQAKQRREKTMALRLAAELQDAANGTGASVKRKEDLHRMAESNKAFAHYRW
jgi:small subunit ribosomal protein S7